MSPSTDVAVRRPWDRRPGESSKAFHNFSIYRDLGPGRSLAKAARALGKATATLEEQSVKGDWLLRAGAWDAEVDRRAQEVRMEAIEQAERTEVAAARLMTGTALIRLSGRPAGMSADGEPVEEVEALDPNDLGAADIARLLEVGVRVRRLTHGQPTDLGKSLDTFSFRELGEIVNEIVELAMERMPDDQHEAFVREVREIGVRARGAR